MLMNWKKQLLSRTLGALYRIPEKGLSKRYSIIIMFHSVSPYETSDAPSCYCSLDAFQQILDYIKVQGYRFVSMDECLLSLANGNYMGQCVISFDDAMDNFYQYAYPVLKTRNIPFILYVPSAQLGSPRIMSRLEIADLSADALCTIGSHTRNHVNCAQCADLEAEIYGSKQDLEDLTGMEIKHFSYPWGTIDDISWHTIQTLKRAGYVSAAGTLSASLHFFSTMSRYYLPRINAGAYLHLLDMGVNDEQRTFLMEGSRC